MARPGVSQMRRKQLIEATVAAIHTHGYDATTMAKIAQRAGMSPGLIAHYFGSKGDLLEATMRSLLTELQMLAAQRLGQAGDAPRARLAAIVSANFDDSQCATQTVAAWLAFWGQVPHEPKLGRLQRIYRRRLHSNLKREFGRLGLGPDGRGPPRRGDREPDRRRLGPRGPRRRRARYGGRPAARHRDDRPASRRARRAPRGPAARDANRGRTPKKRKTA